MTAQIDQLLDDGTACQDRGDLDGAETLYRQALGLDPNHADALQLMGSLRLIRGDLAGAEAHLTKAAQLAPRSALVRINLAAVFLKKGVADKALVEARAARRLAPNSSHALRQTALAAEATGAFSEAVEALDTLARGRAASLDEDIRCSALAFVAGDTARAEAAARRAMGRGGQAGKIFQRAAGIAAARRDWPRLIAIGRSWIAHDPKDTAAHQLLARGLLEAGDVHGAQSAFQAVFDLGAQLAPEHALTYGRICLITQDFDGAETYLRAAADALPDSAEALFSLARLHTFRGDLAAAETACEAALARDPQSIRAYVQLTALKRGAVAEGHAAAMRALWDRADGPHELVSTLGFALGDIAHKAGETTTAFAYYEAANRMTADLFARDGVTYDPAREEARTDLLIEAFSAHAEGAHAEGGHAEGAHAEEDGPEPIFIIGLPRAGTTLTESIIAAHPDVQGAGEVLAGAKILDEFHAHLNGDPAPDRVGQVIGRHRAAWHAAYTAALPAAMRTGPVTDKLPINFQGVGVLAALFPRARFIHIQRDALDTGLSIFRHAFPRAYSWTHDLGHIGHFIRQYRRLMAAYETAYADRLTTIRYEDIPADPEGQMRRIVSAAGLTWDPACAAFHEHRRPIATFSSVQVRAPISNASIGVARPYAGLLQPLLEALNG